jgi:hypothetical protein
MALSSAPELLDNQAAEVIVGFADALSAPEVVWSLRDAGFRVTVLNRRGHRTPLHHARGLTILDVTAPEEDFARCAHEIGEAGDVRRRLLMPIDDAAVAVCARIAEENPSTTVVGPIGRQAELALDKRLQIDVAAQSGFLVPPTAVAETMEQLRNSIHEFPVVLKAANAVSVRDNDLTRGRSFVCADRLELRAAEERWREEYTLLVQPLLVGVGEGLFGLRTAREELLLSAHRRIRMMNPQGSGSSACATAPVDSELAHSAARFLASAEWLGLFMLEFLRDEEGRAYFMELNGRAWGSMALALRVGFDYPAWAVRAVLDPSFVPETPPPRPGVVCRHLGREIVHLLFALRGPSTAANPNWPRPLSTLKDLLRLRRGDRWYNWRRTDWRVFVADSVGTVVGQLRRRGA